MRRALSRIAHELPPSAGGALVLAAIFVAVSVLTAVPPRQPAARPDAVATAAPSVAVDAVDATAAPTTSPTASTVAPPASAGAVSDAGVVYVIGGDDEIHRYDGATGALTRVWARSTFSLETRDGVYALGRRGGAVLLGWSGSVRDVPCGTGIPVSVASTGACVSAGDGIEIVTPHEPARQLLPADWSGAAPTLSPDGRSLLVIRTLRPRPGPGMDPGQSALWLVRPDGTSGELYRPSGPGVLSRPAWSPDGSSALVLRIETTSSSFAADGVGVTMLLIDVASGAVRSLGTVMHGWATWSSSGALAFVRGGGRQTWWQKDLIVRGPDGVDRSVTEPGRVAIAPAWGADGRLGWVSGLEVNDFNGAGYLDGRGAGQRTGVVRIDGVQRRVECGDGRAVEGLRWSSDGQRLLLLCRKPGNDPRPLELWLYRVADDTRAPLVTGLPSHAHALGFGYYGAQPPITGIAAWSLGLPRR